MQPTYTMNLNPATATVDATINGVHVASESSYLACENVVQPLRKAVAEATAFLAGLMTPPAKPAKKTRKATKAAQGCTCPTCRKVPTAEGVFRCRESREFEIYFDGTRITSKPTELAAHAHLNSLRTDALRRAA